MWNERYSDSEFAYGDQPNDFLAANVGQLVAGTCLCLAEGQGRNAVWLAELGWDVTGVDFSLRRAPAGCTHTMSSSSAHTAIMPSRSQRSSAS